MKFLGGWKVICSVSILYANCRVTFTYGQVNSTSMAVEWVRGCVYKMSMKLLFCCLCFVNKEAIWPFSSSKKTNQQEHNFKDILGSKKQPANGKLSSLGGKNKILWWSTKWMKNSQPNLQDWYSFFFLPTMLLFALFISISQSSLKKNTTIRSLNCRLKFAGA